MKKLLAGFCALALGVTFVAGCTESRSDRVGERSDRTTNPSASPTTSPPVGSSTPSTPSDTSSTPSAPSSPSSPSSPGSNGGK